MLSWVKSWLSKVTTVRSGSTAVHGTVTEQSYNPKYTKMIWHKGQIFSAWIWSRFHWTQWDMGWGSLSSWGICQSSHHTIKKKTKSRQFSYWKHPCLTYFHLQLYLIPIYNSKIWFLINFYYFLIFSSTQYLLSILYVVFGSQDLVKLSDLERSFIISYTVNYSWNWYWTKSKAEG